MGGRPFSVGSQALYKGHHSWQGQEKATTKWVNEKQLPSWTLVGLSALVDLARCPKIPAIQIEFMVPQLISAAMKKQSGWIPAGRVLLCLPPHLKPGPFTLQPLQPKNSIKFQRDGPLALEHSSSTCHGWPHSRLLKYSSETNQA